ncbi:unnamed protein product [Prorocentrum cordatum]|uniref:RING-type E3 ubiquitin transferase n=1 Tax=Prorocentrum cordatum TaxID=2364126 RepID=A0ABN9UQ27_9DINO|nr:unnamed protein product [Polarella glacialis]
MAAPMVVSRLSPRERCCIVSVLVLLTSEACFLCNNPSGRVRIVGRPCLHCRPDATASEALYGRFAGLVERPACALMTSERVRAAGLALSRLYDAGELERCVTRAVEVLGAGKLMRSPGVIDDRVLDSIWPAGRGGRDSLKDLAQLLSIGTNEAIGFSVTRGSPLLEPLDGKWQGGLCKLSLEDAGASWGPLARWRVTSGPPELHGLHLVAWQRVDPLTGRTYRSRAELSFLGTFALQAQPGDVLQLARSDRAAYLEVATFDRLPFSAPLVREDDLAELGMSFVDLGSEFMEARHFAQKQNQLGPAEARRARIKRLSTFPIFRQALFVAKRDAVWTRLLPSLAPFAYAVYEAAESQLPRFWSTPSQPVDNPSGLQVIVATTLAAGALLAVAGFVALNGPSAFDPLKDWLRSNVGFDSRPSWTDL